MSESSVSITCGWCGAELETLGSDHRCEEGVRVMAAVRTGDPTPILEADDE